MKRWMAAVVAWVVATAVLVPVCFFAVIVLAGPHSDVLPTMLQGPVLLLGWLTVLGGPAWAATAAWRRVGR